MMGIEADAHFLIGAVMAEQGNPMRELSHDVEFIELPPIVVKEQLLRLFNNQIQRDYVVSHFSEIEGSIVVKLKRRTPLK